MEAYKQDNVQTDAIRVLYRLQDKYAHDLPVQLQAQDLPNFYYIRGTPRGHSAVSSNRFSEDDWVYSNLMMARPRRPPFQGALISESQAHSLSPHHNMSGKRAGEKALGVVPRGKTGQ